MNQCPKCKRINTVTGGINVATFYDWDDNEVEVPIALYWCKSCGRVLNMEVYVETEGGETDDADGYNDADRHGADRSDHRDTRVSGRLF